MIVSNFYPPHCIGGYEIGCRDVVEGLEARGHDVVVLTSTHGLDGADSSGRVYRRLETDLSSKGSGSPADLLRLLKKESTNRRAFIRLCREFRPDVVYVWNAAHISISIALIAQQMGLKVCYFISDHWLNHWESDAMYSLNHRSPRKLPRRLIWKSIIASLHASGMLPSGALNLSHVQFASQFLKRAALEANKPVSTADVIHWGIDVERFRRADSRHRQKRLLYVGQLTEHKGVHTAVEALKLIVQQPGQASTTLTIVGGPDYDDRINLLVGSLGLRDNVQFTGLVPRDRLPSIYSEHEILLFPSIWDEPFSLTVLEAMSSGLAVVATNTGGGPEILKHEENALVFPAADAEACAAAVMRIIESPALREKLRRNGRRTVEQNFKLDDMVDRVDLALRKACGQPV
jgi:glycosyltransferase involved in cell wall biosynthesis